METMLQKWLADNKCKLDKYEVTADKLSDTGYADKSFGFDLTYKDRMARVTLTHSGRLYAHIIETDNATVFLYDDDVQFNASELNGFLICFLQILVG